VCLDKGEDSANCATVNRITIQRENPQNLFNVFATKHYTKDITSPQQVREMMKLDYSEVHYARNTQVPRGVSPWKTNISATFSLPTSTKTKREIGRCPCHSKQIIWLYQTTVINVSKGYFASSESSRKMTRH